MFSIGSLVSSTWLQGVADVAVAAVEFAAHGFVTEQLTSACKKEERKKIAGTVQFGFKEWGKRVEI